MKTDGESTYGEDTKSVAVSRAVLPAADNTEAPAANANWLILVKTQKTLSEKYCMLLTAAVHKKLIEPNCIELHQFIHILIQHVFLDYTNLNEKKQHILKYTHETQSNLSFR